MAARRTGLEDRLWDRRRKPPRSIFVVQPHPAHRAAGLIAALGGEVEPIHRARQQFGPAVIGRIAVEDVAIIVPYEDADAEHVRAVADWRKPVIVGCYAGGAVLRRERHAEIIIEVAV